ncbi:MAG: hypothetical protein R3C39_07600 [Dehalococcoidia bacterium]
MPDSTNDAAPGDPERLTIVPRLERPGAEPRYLLVRWPDWPPPAMLSVVHPAEGDTRAAVDSTLQARMSVTCLEEPRVASERLPVRMRHPRTGREGPGWLRAAAVRVEGEPEADALLDAVVELSLEDALAQLETEVERRLLRAAAALFDQPR